MSVTQGRPPCDACPYFPGERYLDRELPDPAGRSLDEIRPIRNEIDNRVRALTSELVPTSHADGLRQRPTG